MSLSKELLEELYNAQHLSMAEIAERLDCSPNKVAYWMIKHGIPRRDVSEAIYHWQNPDGDPFEIQESLSGDEQELFYLAIALYIGEGKKRDREQVSLSNTEPRVIKVFLKFLREICHVDEDKIWAWINIFDDSNLRRAQEYWEDVTGLPRSQFYKPVVRARRGGTYLNVSEYGTLSVGVNSTRLREIVLQWCEECLNKNGV